MAQVIETPDRTAEALPLTRKAKRGRSRKRQGRVLSLLIRRFSQRILRRTKRWLKHIALALMFAFFLGFVACGIAWHRMGVADAEHAAFCACGTDIKSFLAEYATAIDTSANEKDMSPLRDFYAADYSSSDRGCWIFEPPKDLGGARLSKFVSKEPTPFDRSSVLADLERYLHGIQRVDHVKCKINLIEEVQPEVMAVLTVKYVLDGRDHDNQLFQDRFFLRWHLEKASGAESPGWTIVRDELVEGVRVAGHGDAFVRLALDRAGIDYVHRRDPKLNKTGPTVRLKFAVIEHAFGGVSAVDYDDDGRTDIFFADGVASRLYRNVTPPDAEFVSFADVTSESGLSNIDQAHSALFADIDNDGDKDLFVSRYQAPCRLYRNDGSGHFVDCSTDMRLELTAPCVSACFLDYNLDGYVDLYIGVNGNAHDEAPDIPFYSVNGQPNILLKNEGGNRLVDVTETSGTGNSGWTLAVTSGDYNNDGLPDIAVANDFGRKVLYRNNGDGTFTDSTKEAGVLDFSGGMGVAFVDLDGNGYADLLTSNIESGQRWFGEEITLWQYMRNSFRTQWLWEDLAEFRELYGLMGNDWRDLGKQVGEGNSVFCNQMDGTFVEWKDCNATRAGWAWSVNPFDFDNDGDLDIHVANGWITNKLKDDL